MVARVKRDGAEWEQTFARGVADRQAEEARPGARQRHHHHLHRRSRRSSRRRSSTRSVIRERLEAEAYLHRGLDRRASRTRSTARARPSTTRRASPRTSSKLIAERGKARGRRAVLRRAPDGLIVECALAWTEDTDERVLSFVNGIPTGSGGTHENGLKSGLVKAVRNYLNVHNLIPRG